ncbi:MAG: TylF/MycF family methyltransferase [Xanthobacteraceae bacterium]|nr:TylF/MycF family methyltransferase [Xanthobacteraceae bacterium]
MRRREWRLLGHAGAAAEGACARQADLRLRHVPELPARLCPEPGPEPAGHAAGGPPQSRDRGRRRRHGHVRQGPFTETLSRGFPHGPISILHIDVDVGRSFTEVLAALWDHVASGGVVIFDEYHAASLKAWPDSKPAIDAFLAGKQFTVVDGPGLTRFMVRKQ